MEKAWWENFITYDGLNYLFVAWDETQANALGKFDSYKEAKEAVLTYAKTLNKKESTMDFQVGDEVFCLLGGEGVVVGINNGNTYPITVDFGTGYVTEYNEEGYIYHEDKNPCLYHKGTVVTIKPAQPKRHKWINIYSDNHGNYVVGGAYTSEANALKCTKNPILDYKYVDTIQLKPKGEK